MVLRRCSTPAYITKKTALPHKRESWIFKWAKQNLFVGITSKQNPLKQTGTVLNLEVQYAFLRWTVLFFRFIHELEGSGFACETLDRKYIVYTRLSFWFSFYLSKTRFLNLLFLFISILIFLLAMPPLPIIQTQLPADVCLSATVRLCHGQLVA